MESAAKSAIDLLGIIDPSKPQRVLLLQPDNGPTRDHELYARTRCEITFDNEPDLRACVDALRASDEALKKRPESLKLWVWEATYREDMTIVFGVSWYDRTFFEQRKEAFRSDQHAKFYLAFNATPDRFKVTHEVLQPT